MFGISSVTTFLDFGKTTPLLNPAVSSLVNYTFSARSEQSDAVEVEFHETSVNMIFPYNTSVKAVACEQRVAVSTAIQFSECNRS